VKPYRIGLLLLLALLVAGPVAEAAPEGRFVYASWNTENFFDADDDPDNEGDDEFTAEAWTRWTPARYELKLKHIAQVIAAMKPDVIFLTEIENLRVMRDLRDAVKDAGWDMPFIIHRDGPDKRGIDNAALSRHKPVKVDWLSPTPYQRLVLVAEFKVDGRKLTLFGNHWKSHYGNAEQATQTRTAEARAVRAAIEEHLAADPAAAILCSGDFNDSIDTPILLDEAAFSTNRTAVLEGKKGHLLYNLASGRPKKEIRTYYYSRKNRWDSFDSILVSPGLLHDAENPSPWVVDEATYQVFTLPKMRDKKNGAPIPFRRVVRRTGVEVLSGYSDHFPVRVELFFR
jgi:endonuclease/exonuclease/phosphatase family metal-dependent hydrolase